MATATQLKNELVARIRHRDGCPAERTETYNAERPKTAGGDRITVARCVDCGASSVE